MGFWSKKVKTWTKETVQFGIVPYLKYFFQIKGRDNIAPWERKMINFIRDIDWLTVLNKEISRKRREM